MAFGRGDAVARAHVGCARTTAVERECHGRVVQARVGDAALPVSLRCTGTGHVGAPMLNAPKRRIERHSLKRR
jgi:hypothetical protein